MNTTVSEGGKYLAGEGASLLAIPNGSDPQVLFYNKTILENCGINVISVPESELESYNAANSANLQPHGYAEYKEAPYADALSSKNEAGEFVYRVFNECIGMSWEEQRILARAFQKQYGYEYVFTKYNGKYKQHLFFPARCLHQEGCRLPLYSFGYCVCIFADNLSKEEIKQFHQDTGIRIWAPASVKDEKSIDAALEFGIELITCNNPDEVLQILRAKGLHKSFCIAAAFLSNPPLKKLPDLYKSGSFFV